mmetsp:Transcript_26646/g.41703  ORF Transcript_26646/g.41703 Transcript_26646/m.41703 type:complete len:108 (+) Transcript_26646:397-720(+)
MFKKFGPDEVKDKSKIKSSQQRAIRQAIQQQFPSFEPYLDQIVPKKAEIQVAKCEGKINVVMIEGEPLFYNVSTSIPSPSTRRLQSDTNRTSFWAPLHGSTALNSNP